MTLDGVICIQEIDKWKRYNIAPGSQAKMMDSYVSSKYNYVFTHKWTEDLHNLKSPYMSNKTHFLQTEKIRLLVNKIKAFPTSDAYRIWPKFP